MITGKYYPIEEDSRFPLTITGEWQNFVSGKFSCPNEPCIYALSGYGKLYIGMDTSRTRANYHRSHLRRGKHDNGYIQNVYNKYGESGFYYQPIVLVPLDLKEFICFIENSYIKLFDTYNNGYNLMEFGDPRHMFLGRTHTAETRIKMSNSAKQKIFTEDHRKNLSIAASGQNNPFYGKTHTKETCSKISDSLMGHSYNAGIPKTEDHKNKLFANYPNKVKLKLINENTNEIVEVNGLKRFCVERGLDRRSFYKIILKKNKAYKGWKIYPENGISC